MEMIHKNVGNAEFTFFVNYRGNRSGFVHECELDMNGEHISAAKRQYYNRTWENYRFQSVMLDAVDKAVEDVKTKIRADEMAARGWARLTQQRRNEIGKIVEENGAYKVLRALRGQVSGAKYGTEDERRSLETLDALNAILEIIFA